MPTAVIDPGCTRFLVLEYRRCFYVRAYTGLTRQCDIVTRFAAETNSPVEKITTYGGGTMRIVHTPTPTISIAYNTRDYEPLRPELQEFLRIAVQELYPNHTLLDTPLVRS